jgi:alcohol dehydrogenase
LLSSHLACTVDHPDDLAARLVCQIGSWMSISCIANVPSYLSHVIGHVVGARWHVPHGVTSAIILPVVMSYIAEGAPERAARVAHSLGGADTCSAKDDARDGVELMRQLIGSLPVPTRLRDVNAQVDDFEHVARAVEANLDFFGTTPTVSRDDIISMLHAMW